MYPALLLKVNSELCANMSIFTLRSRTKIFYVTLAFCMGKVYSRFCVMMTKFFSHEMQCNALLRENFSDVVVAELGSCCDNDLPTTRQEHFLKKNITLLAQAQLENSNVDIFWNQTDFDTQKNLSDKHIKKMLLSYLLCNLRRKMKL